MTDIVIDFYQRQTELLEFLIKSNEVSMAQDFQLMLKKNLPLAAASYFESEISKILLNFIRKATNGCNLTMCFLEKKAIKRQYHTLFDWDKRNINTFLAFFGEDFKTEVSEEIRLDRTLDQAAKDFLTLGYIRNCIVHQNYAAYDSDVTSDDIYQKFLSAKKLVAYIEGKLMTAGGG